MRDVSPASGDSSGFFHHDVPGCAGAPFALTLPDGPGLPVLICAPHGGRAYAPDLLAALRDAERAALRLEDRLIDVIATRVAQATGAALLVARAPRAVLDLNRAPDDVDWGMVPETGRAEALAAILAAGGASRAQTHPSQRVRAGLGLVPRRVPGMGELWRTPLAGEVLARRLAGLHAPYHACLSRQLADLRARWGAVLLIDLHSMPPLPCAEGDVPVTGVLGDRFGTSCGTALMAKAFGALDESGRLVAHNRPYAGGYVLERHGNPREGIHAFQLEIDRAAYLESRLVDLGPGADGVVDRLVMLVRRLAQDVAAMGSIVLDSRAADWAEAAE